MKKVININESQLKTIVSKSVKQILKEFNNDDDYNRCLEELSEFTENLGKSYRPDIIKRALEAELEFTKKCCSDFNY